MTRHHLTAAVLIIGLGLGLHLTFRGLAGELPRIFPHVARETPEEIAPPLALAEEADEIAEPAQKTFLPDKAAPLPPSSDIAVTTGEGIERTQRRLVRFTSLPPVPSIPEGEPLKISEAFEIPRPLEHIVGFWQKVYSVYDNHHVILHDTDFLNIQYEVLDFTRTDRSDISDLEKKAIRGVEVDRAIGRIRGVLSELDAHSGAPFSNDAKRIASLFEGINDRSKFKKASDRVRSQTGLKNRFQEGIVRSGRYMPIFEQIFRSYGIPAEISRLVFVESLFKEKAFSKAGAAGLWQFMADTGRRFMTVDHLVDERYDPIAATHAAARLLLRNYNLLGSWPLAINAYNSGAGNLQKAVSQLGTRDIATIVTRFKGGSYAFASRNFYPCFLAALDTYQNQRKFFGDLKKDPLFHFDLLQLPGTLNLPEVAYLAGVSLEDLKELNPAFNPEIFDGRYALPAGSQIRIPEGSQQRFASRFITFQSESTAKEVHQVSSQ